MKPVITLLDIESSPIVGMTWTTWDANVLKIIEPSKIISFAHKNLGDKKVQVKAVSDFPEYEPDKINDEQLIRYAWNVLDKADIVIGHHSNKFDLPKLNSRFVYYGLNAPSHYESVDTKAQASRHFKFDSNSLNNLGQYLGVGQKIVNGGFDLWLRCIAGDAKAWKLMKEYNAQDVQLLEEVYLKLRPFMNHPNVNMITGQRVTECVCHVCQSKNTTRRGFSFTKTGRKQRYQCNECHSWSTGGFERDKPDVEASEVFDDDA